MSIDSKHEELKSLRIDRSQRSNHGEPPTWARRYIIGGVVLVLLLGVVAMLWILHRTILDDYRKEHQIDPETQSSTRRSTDPHPPRNILRSFIFISWIIYLVYMIAVVSIQYGLLKPNEICSIIMTVVLVLIEIILFELTLLTLCDYDECHGCNESDDVTESDHHSKRINDSSSSSYNE